MQAMLHALGHASTPSLLPPVVMLPTVALRWAHLSTLKHMHPATAPLPPQKMDRVKVSDKFAFPLALDMAPIINQASHKLKLQAAVDSSVGWRQHPNVHVPPA